MIVQTLPTIKKWELQHMHVHNAFLHGDFDDVFCIIGESKALRVRARAPNDKKIHMNTSSSLNFI